MIRCITTILANGPARKALGLLLAALAIAFAARSDPWRQAAHSC